MLNITRRLVPATAASIVALGAVATMAPAADAAAPAKKCTTKHVKVVVPKYNDPTWDIQVCIWTEKDPTTKKSYVVGFIKPTMHGNKTSKNGFAGKNPTRAAGISITLTRNGRKVARDSRYVGQYVRRYLWGNQTRPLFLGGIGTSAVKAKGSWRAIGELTYDVSNDKRGAYKFPVNSPALPIK